jgi:hypothetical protein
LSKRVPKNVKALRVSLGAIGENAEFDRELVASILKDVVLKFMEKNKAGKECTLNLKIGVLHAYPNGELQFENHNREDSDDMDAEVTNINRNKPRGRNENEISE